MNRLHLVALCLCVTILATGCWDRREIEDLGFALAAGIDWDEETREFEVTVQMAKPKALTKEAIGGAQIGPAYWLFSARGPTVFGAVRNLTKTAPRKVWWGHTQVIVIGDSAARSGVRSILDFIARDGETRRLYWILITPGRAREILEVESKSAEIGAQALLRLVRIRGATSSSGAVRFHELTVMLSSPMAATTGVVTVAERDRFGTSSDYRLEGAAVFREEWLVGYLDGAQTRGMLWVKGDVRSGIVHVPCPDQPEEELALEVIHTTAVIEPHLRHGKPAVTVYIREEGNLGENPCNARIYSPKDFQWLAKERERAIRHEITVAIEQARNLKADIFGFGQSISRKIPGVWRTLEADWESHFMTMPIDLQITANVRRLGLERKPAAR